ncbi:hypothetical protein SERLA73DRAFT_179330 [Serpula lacrymans var. lacrymans S7.3]|uniref:Uncharacterized protein n=2 Tax=Serpula lacrymans var. lacrymans TaxID=341189 RepID=F8PRX8_SERL3|nr:uncharacterized protein SERLADRAFT_464411 [Serpula lacrymans var. lacrymans S7.9]EGO01213.1 hypothetical protein SERLA73DRAFT_179330 [Serpula lacrymans var. lacrymans S7.3]EGO26862.1 hypothetical protein SERLADRAFT_464411 [Serpula lacrymans var. lacrymans S7.9]
MRAQYGYPPLLTTPCDHSVILARLRLASTVFVYSDQCNFYPSHRMLTYPEVLAYHRFVDPPSIYARNAIFLAQHTLGGRLWSLQVNENAKPVVVPFTEAADIIRACHMNPETTTVDEMDTLDARLRCEWCLAVLQRNLVMTWRTAMYHAAVIHHGSFDHDRFTASSPFTLVQGEDDTRARAFEGKFETFREDTVRFICLLCRRSVGDALDSSDMVKHLLGEHEVLEIASGVHYAFDPISAPHILSPVLLEHQDAGDYSTGHPQHP